VMVLEMSFVLGTTWHSPVAQAVMPDNYNNARALGVVMYTQYVFAIEVGAALLLVGMIAAIALTLRRRRDTKYTNPGDAVRVRAKDRFRLVNLPSQREHPSVVPPAATAQAANPGEKK
jgi:NADH-quinone oxidoreductase subunit J